MGVKSKKDWTKREAGNCSPRDPTNQCCELEQDARPALPRENCGCVDYCSTKSTEESISEPELKISYSKRLLVPLQSWAENH